MAYLLERTFSVIRTSPKSVAPTPSALWETVGTFDVRLWESKLTSTGIVGTFCPDYLDAPTDSEYLYALRAVDGKHCIYRIRAIADGKP